MTKLQDFLNSPITDVAKNMARRGKQGDLFGIELECEGRNVDWAGDDPNLLNNWTPHHDGSLRANHGSCCEWVFNGPVRYKQSIERVDKLFEYFQKRKARLVTSNRTSTHVHFNMGDKNVYQLVNMFILFSILEDVLDRYCGEDRNGNLFCLSSRHAEEQVRWMQDACFKNFHLGLREDQRYCSFNFAAINKFGSVEFRGMRGLDNKEDMLAWLSILNEFCEYACYQMKNPVDLVVMISNKSPRGFIREVFSKDNAQRLIGNLDEHTLNSSVFEGLRLVQMLCYRIGTEFDQVRLKGRDFWASFKDESAPELDVDPKAFMEGGAIPGRRDGRFRPPGAGVARRVQEIVDEAVARQGAPVGLRADNNLRDVVGQAVPQPAAPDGDAWLRRVNAEEAAARALAAHERANLRARLGAAHAPRKLAPKARRDPFRENDIGGDIDF